VASCPACGEANLDHAKFCLKCGSALTGAAPRGEERKLVSVLASPHAAGVSALIVSEFGKKDKSGGLTMDPGRVQSRLEETAVDSLLSQAAAVRVPGCPG